RVLPCVGAARSTGNSSTTAFLPFQSAAVCFFPLASTRAKSLTFAGVPTPSAMKKNTPTRTDIVGDLHPSEEGRPLPAGRGAPRALPLLPQRQGQRRRRAQGVEQIGIAGRPQQRFLTPKSSFRSRH